MHRATLRRKDIDAARVREAVEAAERTTSAEIVVSIAPFFLGRVWQAAQRAFARLGVSRTRGRNGVLVFVVPSRRQVVVLADDGALARVDPSVWSETATQIATYPTPETHKNDAEQLRFAMSSHCICVRTTWPSRTHRRARHLESESSMETRADTLSPFAGPDPAERSWFNRLFYRDRRPTWLGHWVSQFFCWWSRLGLPPRSWFALRARDRNSGRLRADAVVVPIVAGQRYVVSMFGTVSDWVQNLEAGHGEAVLSHGGSQRVRLVLVPPESRAPILREYVRVASSGRKHFPVGVGAPLADFAAIAAQYPVYRIEAHE